MSRGRPRKYDYAQIAGLRLAGLTTREIADRLGCTVPLVTYAFSQIELGKIVAPHSNTTGRPHRDARKKKTVRMRLCANPACDQYFKVLPNRTQFCSRPCAKSAYRVARTEIAARLHARAVELNSLAAASEEFGISRERGRQILGKEGYPTRIHKAKEKPPKPTYTCDHCGQPARRKAGAGGTHHFCSSKCRTNFHHTAEIPQNKRDCAFCGITFYRKNTRTKTVLAKMKADNWYCCQDHYFAHQPPGVRGRVARPIESYPCTCKGEHAERFTPCHRGNVEYQRAQRAKRRALAQMETQDA